MEAQKNSALNKRVGDAWLNFLGGQHPAAIREYEAVLAEDRLHVDALYGLGLVLKASGDISGAKLNWERALEIAKTRVDSMGTTHSYDHERMVMTQNMLKQRLAEIS